jgi:hypothetical protein
MPGKEKKDKSAVVPKKKGDVGSASGASDINRGERKGALPRPARLKKKG